MTEQDYEENNPWQAFTDELEQLPEGPLPSVSGLSVRRKANAVEQWARSFLNGSIPVFFLSFVAMALVCPPQTDSLGLAFSTVLAFPLTWIFRPLLFHGRRGAGFAFVIGGIYLGLIAGVSTMIGSELARKLTVPNFVYESDLLYAGMFQQKIEMVFTPTRTFTLLAVIGLTLIISSKLKKRFVWIDLESLKIATVFICLLTTTLLPLGWVINLVLGNAWTTEEKDWLAQAQESYEKKYILMKKDGDNSAWERLYALASEQGYIYASSLSKSDTEDLSSKILNLWEQRLALTLTDIPKIQRLTQAALNSPNPPSQIQELARIKVRLRFDCGNIDDIYMDKKALNDHIVPFLATAPLPRIESDDWEEDVKSWANASAFNIEDAELVALYHIRRESEPNSNHPKAKDRLDRVRALKIFGREFSPSPTQISVQYRTKEALKNWLDLEEEYRGLEGAQLQKRIEQKMQSEDNWESLNALLYYASRAQELVPALEACQFIIEARRQHRSTGQWPETKQGDGWSFEASEHRVTLKAGAPSNLNKSQTWVLK